MLFLLDLSLNHKQFALQQAEQERRARSPRTFCRKSVQLKDVLSDGNHGKANRDAGDRSEHICRYWEAMGSASEAEAVAMGNAVTFYLTSHERVPCEEMWAGSAIRGLRLHSHLCRSVWISAGGSHFLCQTVVQLGGSSTIPGCAISFWSHCEGKWDDKLMSEYVLEVVDDSKTDVHTAAISHLEKHFEGFGVECLRSWPADQPHRGEGYASLADPQTCVGLGSYTPIITFMSKSAADEIHVGTDNVYAPTNLRESPMLRELSDQVHQRLLE